MRRESERGREGDEGKMGKTMKELVLSVCLTKIKQEVIGVLGVWGS